MTPRTLLFLSQRDPRHDTRLAEMVRIAAGIGAWKRVIPSLALLGPAVLCLDEFADEYPDGNLFSSYLRAIPEHGGSIWVDAENHFLQEIHSALPVTKVSGLIEAVLKQQYSVIF